MRQEEFGRALGSERPIRGAIERADVSASVTALERIADLGNGAGSTSLIVRKEAVKSYR
jgi:hypothetical protein